MGKIVNKQFHIKLNITQNEIENERKSICFVFLSTLTLHEDTKHSMKLLMMIEPKDWSLIEYKVTVVSIELHDWALNYVIFNRWPFFKPEFHQHRRCGDHSHEKHRYNTDNFNKCSTSDCCFGTFSYNLSQIKSHLISIFVITSYEAWIWTRTLDTTQTPLIIWENHLFQCNYKCRCRIGVRHDTCSTPEHA